MEEATNVTQEFPPKPLRSQKEISRSRFITSFLLFLITFYFILNKDLQFLCILTAVLFIHELGHFVAMKIFGYADVRIFFIPFFGAATTGHQKIVSQKQRAITLLAGPLPGIIIGSVLLLLFPYSDNPEMKRVALVFIYLNLFNLLPVYPLDGGQLVTTFFSRRGPMIVKVFVLLSMAAMIYYAMLKGNYFFYLIAFYLLIFLTGFNMKIKARKELVGRGYEMNKTYDELTDMEYWTIRDYAAENVSHFKKLIKKYDYSISEKENRVINFIDGLLISPVSHDLKPVDKVIILVIWVACFFIPLYFNLNIPFLNLRQ